MTCHDLARALEESRDGGPQLPSDLVAHADGCAACSRRIEAESRLVDGLRGLRDDARRTAVPAGFARSVRRASATRRAVAQARWPIGLAAALAAGVLIATFVALVPGTSDPQVLRGAQPSSSPATASAAPVVWSNGGTDVVLASAARTGDVPTAVLVEWDL